MTLKPFKSQKAEISQIHAKTVAGAGFQPRSGNRAPTPGIGPPDPNPDPDPRFLTALRFPNNFWKNVSARDAFPFGLCAFVSPPINENHSIGHPNRFSGEEADPAHYTAPSYGEASMADQS